MLKTKVKYFELNEKGRDFVVGDIHGCLATFKSMLEKINFNYQTDRMFSVGDLVDRGPNSMDCLSFLYAPWFHAVYANHEDFMVNALEKPYHDQSANVASHWIANGGSWHQWEDSQLLDEVCARIREQVPYVNVVQTPSGRVNIAHAQILYANDEQPADDQDIDEWNFHDINETSIIWSRTIFQRRHATQFPATRFGLSTTYVGHSVTTTPFQKDGHRFIDTGCVFGVLEDDDLGYGLTTVDLTNGVVHFINSKTNVHSEKPIDLVFIA